MKHIYKLLFFLTFSISSFAGTIKGFITDSKTGEPLVGATVMLEKTKFGSSVNLDGSFEIKGIFVGNYTCKVQYVGYASISKSISITNAQTILKIDFVLVENFNELSEIIVSASADKETDNFARKTEQKSDNVMNILSAKTIELLPDVTVGNVLQRVSGVSVVRNNSGDGQYAIIRGMDKRYNYTLVNGIKIPSPDNKNRYVPMDIFPADLLERLEVVKALTPNMEGDAIGGAMNMVMKSAPDRLTISATATAGYSQLFANQPFSGFSTKDINFKSPFELRNDPKYIAVPSDFNTKYFNYQDVTMPINSSLGLSIGNRILNRKLGFILAGSYQNTYRGSNTVFFVPNGQPSPDPIPNTPLFERVENRTYSTLQTRIGGHLKLDYVFNPKNRLSLYNVFMLLDDATHRKINTNSLTLAGDLSITDRSIYRRQTIYNSTLQGEHALSDKLKANWSLAYSLATSITPDWGTLNVTYSITQDIQGNKIESGKSIEPLNHIWSHNEDADRATYLNLIYRLNKNIEISTGGLYRDKNRSNFYTNYKLSTVLKGGIKQPYSTVGSATFNFFPASDAFADTTDGNNYKANEKVVAFYLQSKINLGQKLQIVGGVRAENTDVSYQSQLPKTTEGYNGNIKYLDILPSIHFKYALDNRQNIRLSYFKGISRPGYFEYIPAVFPGDYYDESGNPNIKHTVADNLDLRYEFFPKGNEQFLIGAFYKNIMNPIEYGFSQVGNNSYLYKPQNYGNAQNYGIELVVAKYLKNWGISANYTYTHSEITTSKRVYYRDANGSLQNAPPATAEYPTPPQQTRPLQGQSDHIGNISLLYKNPKIGFDAQLSWVYTGKRINVVTPYKDLDWWQKATSQVDFSTEKVVVKNWSVFVKATNLLNNPVIVEILKPNTLKNYPEQTSPDKILVQQDVFNQGYQAGVRYRVR